VKNSFNDNLLPAFTEKPTDRVSLENISVVPSSLKTSLDDRLGIKKIHLVGIGFSSAERNISEYLVEEYN